jgi:hypothetical protein
MRAPRLIVALASCALFALLAVPAATHAEPIYTLGVSGAVTDSSLDPDQDADNEQTRIGASLAQSRGRDSFDFDAA